MTEENNNYNQPEEEEDLEKHETRRNIRRKLLVIESLIILAMVLFGWIYYQIETNKRQEVNENLETLKLLEEEREYCLTLVSEETGNLEEYDYCKRFLKKFSQ